MSAVEIIGGIVSLLGALLLLLAALGLIRMPDVYNRMQAGTKATTLGTMLFLIGIAVAHPGWWAKVLVLILFVVFTNPISSHALARAAHHVGIRMSSRTVRDDLADRSAQAGEGSDRDSTAKTRGGATS
jgi:multicomponent Na+:H+ antiporter subunit G